MLGDGPGIFPIGSFPLSRPINQRGTVPKGSATQSGPFPKKVGNTRVWKPPRFSFSQLYFCSKIFKSKILRRQPGLKGQGCKRPLRSQWSGTNYPDPPILAFLEKKSKGFASPKKQGFFFAEPLKSLEKRGKTHKKARKIRKQKKQGKPKKQGLEGQGEGEKAADVWKKDVWDFQLCSQTFLELRFSLENTGKDGKRT